MHSNDIHGDFQEEVVKGAHCKMAGGLSRLSGYINKVRREEKNVIYLIAGNMVQGAMIDTEFKGVSTMELMNYLSPEVATIGNHELDYYYQKHGINDRHQAGSFDGARRRQGGNDGDGRRRRRVLAQPSKSE